MYYLALSQYYPPYEHTQQKRGANLMHLIWEAEPVPRSPSSLINQVFTVETTVGDFPVIYRMEAGNANKTYSDIFILSVVEFIYIFLVVEYFLSWLSNSYICTSFICLWIHIYLLYYFLYYIYMSLSHEKSPIIIFVACIIWSRLCLILASYL